MEKLSKIAWYYQWIRGTDKQKPPEDEISIDQYQNMQKSTGQFKNDKRKLFFDILESILLWENTVTSISIVIVFNILFWGIVVLEIRGFAAASSAALVVVLCYSTLESQVEKEQFLSPPSSTDSSGSLFQLLQMDRIINKTKMTVEGLKDLRKKQPGTFCIAACVVSIALWIVGRTVNCVLLTYAICMGLLVGPGLFFKLPKKVLNSKEWESEIEEFLPVITEDNVDVLNRAGEIGDRSPTPPSRSDHQIDTFDDDDDEMIGLKMPSHEDGSTDGLELSDELELSTGEIINGTNGLTIQSKHFEGNNTSSDEEELDLKGDELSSNSDDSESDFEVIDSHDIANLNVNSTGGGSSSSNKHKL